MKSNHHNLQIHPNDDSIFYRKICFHASGYVAGKLSDQCLFDDNYFYLHFHDCGIFAAFVTWFIRALKLTEVTIMKKTTNLLNERL
jgi:hypothetical protein